MAPWIRRLHLLELNDQEWVPQAVRSRVQTCLTLLWTLKLPIIQSAAPAALVGTTLRSVLGANITRYTFVDFCAGAGGPTPVIERELNRLLAAEDNAGDPNRSRTTKKKAAATKSTPTSPHGGLTNGSSKKQKGLSYADVARPDDGDDDSTTTTTQEAHAVDFVLTDINPHRAAWATAAQQSAHMHYVARPVDASAAGDGLLGDVTMSPLATSHGAATQLQQRGTFRLFFLAFHHMPDHLARAILRDTLASSDGFGIFELQGRTVGEFVMICLIWPLLLLVAPFYFYNDPMMLFLVYIVPAVPFVLVLDGIVSCLRTRTGSEIEALIRESGADTAGWRLREGDIVHTWPIGRMRWYVGVRE